MALLGFGGRRATPPEVPPRRINSKPDEVEARALPGIARLRDEGHRGSLPKLNTGPTRQKTGAGLKVQIGKGHPAGPYGLLDDTEIDSLRLKRFKRLDDSSLSQLQCLSRPSQQTAKDQHYNQRN